MENKSAYLVIGADSLVGGETIRAFKRRGAKVYGGTRRIDTLSGERVFVDFEAAEPPTLPADVGRALVVAAATNYDRCAKDPRARVVNVELIPRLIGNLLERGIFVTYISTNSVFGGDRPWPGEDDPHAPGLPYAVQKSESEARTREIAERLALVDRYNVVRLTKIMNAGVSPLPAWFAAWERGDAIEPFADLIFAPMSTRFVGEGLVSLASAGIPGNLHLSGAENISYVDLANALAGRLGIDPSLIRPTTATEKGVHIPFKPRYSGIGMLKTNALCGVSPQPFAELVDDIVSDYKTSRK